MTRTYTGNCRNPQEFLQNDQDIKVFVVSGYINESEPVMEGTTVNYTCPSGLVHSGPSSSTCTGKGEWEPDPRGVECNGKKMGYIILT